MKPTLRDISTRELLKALPLAVMYCDWYSDYGTKLDISKPIFVAKRLLKGGEIYEIFATEIDIRAVLKTRPHIPGKKEAKVIRRLMAKTGQSEEWLRAHSRYGQELVDAQYPNRRIVTPEWAASMSPHYGPYFQDMFKVVA